MIIKNGYIIDPLNKKEGVFDILIEKAKIKEVSKNIKVKDKEIIDAKNKIVAPGLIDMHVHLREPGREDIETVASGTAAAISGGITSICSMPNTRPSIDNPENLELLKNIIKKDAATNVFIIGAITKERKGRRIVNMKAMKKAGARALTDDGNSIQDKSVMLEALKKAEEENILLISHCENKAISKNGVVNEGIIATKLGLRGIPKKAEYDFVKRDIELAKETGAKIHIAHVSCKESVEIIRKAKKNNVKVTAETAPHYFSLGDTSCVTYDTRTKMNPPLRSSEDIKAVKEGLADGTIDVIASDHAPHGKHEKEIEFELAAFGIIGLETSLSAGIMNLIEDGKPLDSAPLALLGTSRDSLRSISWMRLIELMSVNPAGILGLKHKGSLSAGSDADITIIDAEKKWVYAKNSIQSKSKNSPFINRQFKGKVVGVVVGGKRKFPTAAV